MELKKTFSNILEKFNSNKIFNWFKEKYLILLLMLRCDPLQAKPNHLLDGDALLCNR